MAIFLGLISGTSMDGIDAALVDVEHSRVTPRAFRLCPYAPGLHARLERLVKSDNPDSIAEIGRLHTAVGQAFAAAALVLLEETGLAPSAIRAVGSHGQTIAHAPGGEEPFSFQIGDPSVIAYRTGIATVGDFRAKDIAAGGQGAPLVPLFHEAFFRRDDEATAVVNIGGIANVTLLPATSRPPVLAFDCGPGNTLMDLWCRSEHGAACDYGGAWAASGQPEPALLARLRQDPYFALAPPKSTGREYFNRAWLDSALSAVAGSRQFAAANVQATLSSLTALTIADAIHDRLPEVTRVLICGGGVRNAHLLRLLRDAMPSASVETTASSGLDPDFVEAVAFGWLAWRRMERLPGNLPTATGAPCPLVLGGLYLPD